MRALRPRLVASATSDPIADRTRAPRTAGGIRHIPVRCGLNPARRDGPGRQGQVGTAATSTENGLVLPKWVCRICRSPDADARPIRGHGTRRRKMGKRSRFSRSVLGLFCPNGFAVAACHQMPSPGQSVHAESGRGKWVSVPDFPGRYWVCFAQMGLPRRPITRC